MHTRILVAGETCIDQYIHGASTRFSPEDPTVPVVSIEQVEEKEGMASNVFNNLESIGAKVTLFQNNKEPGIIKTRVFSNGKQIARLDNDKFEKIVPDEKAVELLHTLLDEHDALLVQDYGKGFWNETTTKVIQETNKPVFVDPYSTTPLSYYKGCTLLTPNLVEAKALTGKDKIEEILQELIVVTDCRYAIVTLGAEGMVMMEKNEWLVWSFHADPVQVVDVCGAGDTVISVIAFLYLRGYSIEKCIGAANQAAAQVIQQAGVSRISFESMWKITDAL